MQVLIINFDAIDIINIIDTFFSVKSLTMWLLVYFCWHKNIDKKYFLCYINNTHLANSFLEQEQGCLV